MTGWISGWRLALRLARRDAVRSKARSAMVLVMIALPVLIVTTGVVLLKTQSVNSIEGLPRTIGGASALVETSGESQVIQPPDPNDGYMSQGKRLPRITEAAVAKVLPGASLLTYERGDVVLDLDSTTYRSEALITDFTDAATHPLLRLRSGRLPEGPCQVVINPEVASYGYAIGDRITARGDSACTSTVVGIADSAGTREGPFVAGTPGSLPVRSSYNRGWLVTGPDVTWLQVLALNQLGAVVTSRAVIENPPPMPPEFQQYSDNYQTQVAGVLAVLATMILLEVVLLAGPAFAVGARRQSRDLALIATSGGTPAQSRRVVLGTAVVLGTTAAVIGVGLGVGAARLLEPVAQDRSYSWFGPFEIPWLQVLGAAAFGVLAAFLAAVVPAFIASRQDVVAVLAGRRADRPPSLRNPVVGLVLLGGGVLAAVGGARAPLGSEGIYLISLAAIVSVFGAILVVPLIVVLIARVGRWFPLPLRYAVRDAARHRTRTVPAVAAVAATVAGVVALGIALSSDNEQQRDQYTPAMAMGAAAIQGSPGDLPSMMTAIHRATPDVELTPVRGVPLSGVSVNVSAPGRRGLLMSSSSVVGAQIVVGDTMPRVVPGIDDAARAAADRALAQGRAVVFFTSGGEPPAKARFRIKLRHQPTTRPLVDAFGIAVPESFYLAPQAVVPTSVAKRIGLPYRIMGYEATENGGTVSRSSEKRINDALAGVNDSEIYVERGYQTPSSTVIAQFILGAMGALLMLGGTLTATFLALSDARADLATLSAVGAAPRTRRLVAAGYALSIGGVGALLGAVIGFIPGIAVTYPMSTSSYYGSGRPEAHYVAIPWGLVGVVVLGLPLLTGVLVALVGRSRLPLVSRLT